jgi:hypothetical protein
MSTFAQMQAKWDQDEKEQEQINYLFKTTIQTPDVYELREMICDHALEALQQYRQYAKTLEEMKTEMYQLGYLKQTIKYKGQGAMKGDVVMWSLVPPRDWDPAIDAHFWSVRKSSWCLTSKGRIQCI